MIHRSLKLAFILALCFALSARAQTTEQLLLLQSNPGLAQQIQNQIGGQSAPRQPTASSIPTSKKPEVLNSNDAVADPKLITQSRSLNSQNDSVVQRYYRILAGNLLPVYGAAEFSQSQDTQLLFFNTMGKDYRLAAGDVIKVTLRGLTESDASYKIGRDGNLILPALAPLNVSGLTIFEAEEKLLNILRYDDAAAAVFMSLDTARLITVQVSGAVENPRTLAVPAFTPLSRVLAYAGGIKPTGSLRNIILRDRDGGLEKVDFYDFLQSPVGANDPLVTDSSRIFIGNQGKTVAAIGFVARPGIYELDTESNDISVRDLLSLTGTNILPPGMEFEILYFDNNGITNKRKVDLDGRIRSGEVLDLRFVETRLQSSIQVAGAVLDQYELASDRPVPLRALLKEGAVLSQDAFLDFALLISKSGTSSSFSLRDKLLDPDFFIPIDSILFVFDMTRFKQVIDEDPNVSEDPIVGAITQTELAELFLNGKRIALLPPNKDKSFSEQLRPFYRLTPDISLDLAIIESENGAALSMNLRSLLMSNNAFPFNPGHKIHLFENKFLAINAQNVASDVTQTPVTKQSEENWRVLSQLFSRAGVVQVRVDEQVYAFLSGSDLATLSSALDSLGFKDLSRFSDLVVSEQRSLGTKSAVSLQSLYNLNTATLPVNLKSIEFYSKDGKQKLLSDTASPTFEQLEQIGLSIYVDYTLNEFGLPSDLLHDNSELSRILGSPDIYPLFALNVQYNKGDGFWTRDAVSLEDIKSPQFLNRLEPGSKVFAFTTQFLKNLLSSGSDSDSGSGSGSGSDAEQQLLGLQASGLDLTDERSTIDVQNELISNRISGANEDVEANFSRDLQFILSSSRYISGAVERPGFYPVSGSVTLSELIAAAGGLTENADITRIELVKQKIYEGKIIADDVTQINLGKVDGNTITLSNRYTLNVPSLINEVATGIVTLKGEVERPGEYLIARNDTLHDLIERAGGFTPVAFPLGAVFTRESLKDIQRDSNALLANQLEQAVLQVAQSDAAGAGEQVQAVLGYARQLRTQEVTGRLSVNVTHSEISAPVYLQSGDSISIPKRPAHVSVIGSVQKDTVASYGSGKRLYDYLSSAGGANKIADLKRAYILLPNGESTTAHHDSIIPPGSVIVVPPKTDRLSALGLTDLVSRVLGNIATSILAINNVR